MWIDFFLFVSFALAAMKFSLHYGVDAETTALVLVGFALMIGVARIAGSDIFSDRARPVKIIGALIMFAYPIAGGNWELTLLTIGLVVCVAISMFGFYVMLAPHFAKREMSRRNDSNHKFWAIMIFLVIGFYLVAKSQ